MLMSLRLPRWAMRGISRFDGHAVSPHNRSQSSFSPLHSKSPSKAELIRIQDKAASHEAASEVGRKLKRLPTSALLRNIFLGAVFSSPTLSRVGLACLRKIAEAKSPIINPDKNVILRIVLKMLLYNHFCAGISSAEIQRTRDTIKRMGFSGVALCYGKEVQADQPKPKRSFASAISSEVDHWRRGNLETIDMVHDGDWLGMKLTGAGTYVTNALMKGEEAPAVFVDAMDQICARAAARGCRIWIDAEQQVLQSSIDQWTIDLMRRHNRNGQVLVYNTLQAYLKASRSKLVEQAKLANQEGWTLAVKLVRGAYIDTDERALIHDTKQETDDAYNGIVDALLTGDDTEDGLSGDMRLLIAGHNPDSVARAWQLMQSLHRQGRLRVVPEFAQLQGMGDVLGCKYLDLCDTIDQSSDTQAGQMIRPRFYKCLTWGSVQECMQYLFRRAVENRGGTERMRDAMGASWDELRDRVGFVRRRKML